jgi:hypothetical protein
MALVKSPLEFAIEALITKELPEPVNGIKVGEPDEMAEAGVQTAAHARAFEK